MFKKIGSLSLAFLMVLALITPAASAKKSEKAPSTEKQTVEINGKAIGVYSEEDVNDPAMQEFLEIYEQAMSSDGETNTEKDGAVYVVPNPGSGWDNIGYRDNTFQNNTYTFIKNTLSAAVGSIAAVASAPLTPGGQIAVGTFAGAGAHMVLDSTLSVEYNRTWIFEYYSSYYGKYVYRPVTNLHQTRYRNDDEIEDTTVGPVLEMTTSGLQPI
jgi:hypothetical protein